MTCSWSSGTKIESTANKYTFVWKKAGEKNEAKLDANLRGLLKETDGENKDENDKYSALDWKNIGETKRFRRKK